MRLKDISENMKSWKKATLVFAVVMVLIVGVAFAVTIYEWWSLPRVLEGEVTAVVIWGGNLAVEEQIITVSIKNTKTATSTGTLNIKIYDGPTKTDNLIADLTPDQAVSVSSGQTMDYTKTWTPDVEGTYYALATYTED